MKPSILNIERFSLQDLFDFVYNELKTQNRCSFNDEQQICVYRDIHGNKCAIGVLIPDEIYNDSFEKCGIYKLLEYAKYSVPLDFASLTSNNQTVKLEYINFLSSLRTAHDSIIGSNNFLESLNLSFMHLANNYQLKFNP